MQLNEELDGKSLYSGGISELETDKEFSSGNFLLLKLMVGKKQNFAVYQIEEMSGRVVKINYLCKSDGKFIFPECNDCIESDFQDIIMNLLAPGSVRGTGHTATPLPFPPTSLKTN